MGKILRYTRLALSVVLAVALTSALVFPEKLTRTLGAWVAKIQLLPLAMSFAIGWFALWIVLTLILGRVYCASFCPMGAFQDLVASISRRTRKKPYRYHPASNRTRYILLAIVGAAILLGASVVVSVVDPYSAYARMMMSLSHPARASLLGLAISIVTLVAVAAVAARRGRLVCNTVCPVGATLGLVSRYAIYHIDIDTDKCIQCRKCVNACKAECIDLQDHVIDTSRCVVCFNCLPVCPNDAIHYTATRKQLAIPMMQRIEPRAAQPTATIDAPVKPSAKTVEESEPAPLRVDRRTFMATGLIVASALAGSRLQALAGGDGKGRSPVPDRYVTPPGIRSRQSFLNQCTGCGLCIVNCPTGVLKPSTREYGLLNALHPYKDYDHAKCKFGCTRCTRLCPSGALLPLTKDEKKNSIIGTAQLIPSNCLSVHGEECGQCASACPKSAIDMKATGSGSTPVVNPGICIGCGACQNICPATPFKAMIVEGIS